MVPISSINLIGYIKNGKRCGPGTYVMPIGNIYNGEWFDDKIHGLG